MIPKTAVKYKETKEFTEKTVPRGLLADHSTAEGVWGNLVVLEGRLEFVRPGNPPIEVLPEKPMVILPQEIHYITCEEPVRFKVEFYRDAG